MTGRAPLDEGRRGHHLARTRRAYAHEPRHSNAGLLSGIDDRPARQRTK